MRFFSIAGPGPRLAALALEHFLRTATLLSGGEARRNLLHYPGALKRESS